MTLTDLITSLLSLFLMALGYSRGFLRSLLGPIALIAATILSVIYYQYTGQLITSLMIGLVGPLVLLFILKFILKSWISATKSKAKPEFPSRLAGLAMTLLWGWVFIILTLVLLAIFPSLNSSLTFLHNDVTHSYSYALARPLENLLVKPAPATPLRQRQAEQTRHARSAPAQGQSLATDPRFQKVLQDPEVQREIQERDYAKLMQNPKMMALTQQIMNDPSLMQKVLSAYKNRPQAGAPEQNSAQPAQPAVSSQKSSI